MAPSRTKIWSNWAVVVSWAIAWPRVDSILPMPTDILKAFTWELLCTGTSRSVTIAFWSSVQTRHKVAGLKPLIIGAGEVSAWTRCLASLCLLRDQRDRLMVCDIWFGFHTGYGIRGFDGPAAVHVGRRKNDCERKGASQPSDVRVTPSSTWSSSCRSGSPRTD